MIRLEKYTETYLDKSWEWLNDPEIKFLTNTPDFTLEEQSEWFAKIQKWDSYKIWGVSYDEIPVGVFGIKNIDLEQKSGEYWGYIGNKEYWGKGIGKAVMEQLIEIAQYDLKIQKLYLKVIKENYVAISLYKKFGFRELDNDGKNIIMVKNIISL